MRWFLLVIGIGIMAGMLCLMMPKPIKPQAPKTYIQKGNCEDLVKDMRVYYLKGE